MKNIVYNFLAPVEGEPISARFRGVIASCDKCKVFVVVGDKTEEATPEWWITQQDCLFRANMDTDYDFVHKFHCEMWEKSEALRELQKVAALAGRLTLVDYISSIFNAVPVRQK